MRVCGRAKEPDSALVALRRLGRDAPPEAYVSVIISICTDESPNMELASSTANLMQSQGALDKATPGQLLRLYVALVIGYGSRDLDAAHEAFEEGMEWMNEAQQLQLKEAEQEEAYEWMRRIAATEAGQDAEVTTTAATILKEEEEEAWSEGEWQAAERALYRVMVEAAAPHPRGLLLACTLLENLHRNSGQRLGNGYYSQLISGHATAHELHIAMGALTNAQRQGVSSSGWRVADSTIASLMDAINRRQADYEDADGGGGAGMMLGGRGESIQQLGDAGLQMDRKVADYLASGGQFKKGRRSRGREVNANDDLVISEKGGRAPLGPREYDLASGRRVARAGAYSDADEAVPSSEAAKQQYKEFEKLLEERQAQPSAANPKPDKDTKRSVNARRLRNLGNL